jgi:hypothetical protein
VFGPVQRLFTAFFAPRPTSVTSTCSQLQS